MSDQHSEYDYARDDAKFLRTFAAKLSYNDGMSEAVTKSRLNEISMRLETKFYVPKERAEPIPLAQPRTNPIPQPTPSAPALLAAAAGHMRDRAATYDKPEGERSMGKTVEAFNTITGRNLRESEGWLLLGLLKMVRSEQRQQPHRDSVEDLIAYAALFGEARLGDR